MPPTACCAIGRWTIRVSARARARGPIPAGLNAAILRIARAAGELVALMPPSEGNGVDADDRAGRLDRHDERGREVGLCAGHGREDVPRNRRRRCLEGRPMAGASCGSSAAPRAEKQPIAGDIAVIAIIALEASRLQLPDGVLPPETYANAAARNHVRRRHSWLGRPR